MKRLAARKIMVRKADEPSSWPFKLLLNLVSLESKGLLTRIQKFEACWNGVAKHYYYHKWSSECFESSWTATYRTYCSFWNSPDYSYDVEWHFNNNLRKHYSVQLSSVSSAAKPMTILIQEIRPHLPDHLPALIVKQSECETFSVLDEAVKGVGRVNYPIAVNFRQRMEILNVRQQDVWNVCNHFHNYFCVQL